MSKAISCKNGASCTFLKEGKCKYTHPSVKSQPHVAKPKGVAKFKKNFSDLLTSKEFKAMAVNRTKRKELFAKYKMDMSSYFDVKDNKDVKVSSNSLFDRELKILDEEFGLMRGMMRSAFGNQLIKIKLWSLDNWAIAGNNITGVIAVDPSPISEFTTLAALFDEYRVVGGHVDLFTRAVSNSSNGATVDPRIVYAYDPSEVANLTTVVTALQLQHHVLMHAVSDTNSTTSISPSRVHYDFDYKVPPMALAAAGTNPATGENWQATTSSAYLPYGWTKAVGINFVQAAVTVGIAATHTYHVEFRCRT
jgi:hypothetical protein